MKTVLIAVAILLIGASFAMAYVHFNQITVRTMPVEPGYKPRPPILNKDPMTVPTAIVTTSPDSVDTLSSPVKIMMSDNVHYFLVGAPAGQNNKAIKKIIFSLPGHGSSADQDYKAWSRQLLLSDSYALASVNWWDGEGETPGDYLMPAVLRKEIEYFLKNQGYVDSDKVILEGFSRGSANTYSVVGVDVLSGRSVIDGVISASGKYQSDFAMNKEMLAVNNGQMYQGIPWVLACGVKDDNPTRDGCEGMRETENFLKSKGANVLAVLEDSNGGHGAFHMSELNMAVQALALFDKLWGN